MKSQGVGIALIGTLAAAKLPYSLKVLWAPLMDSWKMPFLYNLLGRRRSWMVVCCVLNALWLFLLSLYASPENFSYVYFIAVMIGFTAATFDIACDGLRIDKLSDDLQGPGASVATVGFRIGAYISGAFAIYLSGTYAWSSIFIFISCLFLVGIFVVIYAHEPRDIGIIDDKLSIREKISMSVINPLRDLFSAEYSVMILCGIMSYKIGDAMLSFMASPFYHEIGYTMEQIGGIAKITSLFSSVFGSIVGGAICYRIGNMRGLLLCGVAQMIFNLIYIWLHYQPVSNYALFVTTFVENFTSGMGAAAIVGLISSRCNKKYGATQYALLCSVSTLGNNTIVSSAGKIVEIIGWDKFFIFTVLISIPSLVIFYFVHRLQLAHKF
jgi:PAT family beta-lactamase induction signal transducer AmpG